ncbi:MarR family winged helix-turn-helix transcriptional regulator [Curtobacterium caseinilyticum]|uniref:MarR family winged helix-turn-helix transcriptional regulator n=1 Tax=Curtobacterium caseinilyticum TaxID=3055137 RepID=A0ABT7TPU6_9MICO|nr:MarR family winged helix-turn-helix transcriptional regulator [Curtobacterium caseinilyticum]MDM7891626.1 MarR family winged helix-turn-helix transcriptional regulator [Curtobacterium caseinilyticum]
MTDDGTHGASGYWYPDRQGRTGVELLTMMRRYRAAEVAMRERKRRAMGMNATDMEAVRFLLRAGEEGRAVRPGDLTAHLGITSASTTAVVRRLVASGHVERRADPSDGRGALLVATGHSDDEVRTELTDVHARMIAAADRLSPQTIAEMRTFFTEVTAAMAADSPADEVDGADRPRPLSEMRTHQDQ